MAALFVQLCRECRALRHWLWEDFTRDKATRERFARSVRGRSSIEVARIADHDAAHTGPAIVASELHRP